MGTDVPCTSIVTVTWQDLDAWAGARAPRLPFWYAEH